MGNERIEIRVLNVFLYQQDKEGKKHARASYKFTKQKVRSWRESLEESTGSYETPLGEDLTPEQIAELVKKEIERMHMPSFIERICLHNEAPWQDGEKLGLPQQEYLKIHSLLNSRHVKVYSEPEVWYVP
jgi:hypothetical protein